MNEVLLLSCLVLCAAGTFEHSDEDILVQGYIEDSGGDSKRWLRSSTIAVDNQPVGNEGNLLEQEEKSKEDYQQTEQSMINGERFDPKDLAIDFDEDTSKVTIDGVKGAENEAEGDPALQGDKENSDWASEKFYENFIVKDDGQPAEGEGELLEQKEKSKQYDQAVGNSVINGEEFGPGHVEFDSAEDPTIANTDEAKGELDEPEEEPTHFELNPCEPVNYKLLDTKDRLVENKDQSLVKCDQRDLPLPGWFRFTDAGGDHIPESCVPMRRCGTQAPGWLSGKHPSVQEGVVVRQVCYHWTGGCCQWKNNVKIRNCGNFYVYELQRPPVCALRYCGDKGAFNPCFPGKYKLLNTYDRLVVNKDQNSVKCDQRDIALPGWFRFIGAAGDRMPTKCPATNRCGTRAPGWLNEKHPSVADGIVSREVCYHWSKNCCRWKNKINVKNCGVFYVYELQKPPACSLRYCGETTECSDGGYQVLNQTDRAMANSDQSRVKCDGRAPDNILVPKWYRMTGDSGDQIPENCVSMRRCGTHAPGWLNGSHPSVQEGVVARQVCYHWTGGCCQWKNNIQIRNCGDFYVYELQKPPTCSLRYCGNKKEELITLPPPTTAPKPVFDPCYPGKYKLLNSYDRFVGNSDQSSIKCDQRDIALDLPGWFRLTGAAGDKMSTKCPETNRCGTHAPGWLNGKLPSDAEGIVSREVCYHWSKNCCRWKNKINVKNCGPFYVYELQKPPACSLRYCGEATECSNDGHQDLNQADRTMANSDQSRVKCDGRAPDNILVPKWYRMTGDSGDQIPESCVPMRRCGTRAPGWLNGSHPSLQEGVVARQVCYHWTRGCCQWKNNIQIRNCGDFYVYELQKPPACTLRYCGNKEAPTTQPPIIKPTPSPGVSVTCGKDGMFISIPKNFLPGMKMDHLSLSDINCGATETQTHFILRTKLKECHTTSRDTNNSVCFMNKVLEISVEHQPIITRVREVEIPFSCCYSNTGIVSSVGLHIKSKKVVLSKNGFGEFTLEMKIFPDNRFIDQYESEDFPVNVPSGKLLFVDVSVDTEDLKLEILAETCFATPDSNPFKPGLKYLFIYDGCAVDDTLEFIPSDDERSQRFSLAAFKFLGDHQYVYLHCKLKICNATDPKSRCAQGCLHEGRRKRSLYSQETNDEGHILAQGPFVRSESDVDETDSQKQMEMNEVESPYTALVTAVIVVFAVVGVTCGSIYAWKKKRRASRSYQLFTVPSAY